VRVVDCHVHLHSRTYFEAHVGRTDRPFAERNRDGYVFHTRSGESTAVPMRLFDVGLQLEELDAEGVNVAVSGMGALTVDHLSLRQATELAMHSNEERADLERRFPGRFYALALIPMQDAQAAIETLEHAIRTLALRGVSIAAGGSGNWIGSESRGPVFRRIAELGVPLFLKPYLSPFVTRLIAENPALTVVHPPATNDLPCHVASAANSPERLLFASDYPNGSPAQSLDAIRGRLDGAALDAALSGNAAALLGLN
jgi:predicted TIM-barrel fold metal-dependent hydrolase